MSDDPEAAHQRAAIQHIVRARRLGLVTGIDQRHVGAAHRQTGYRGPAFFKRVQFAPDKAVGRLGVGVQDIGKLHGSAPVNKGFALA